MSKLTDMLRSQFECDHENPDCPKTVGVDCDQLGEAIVDLCELFDGAERARDKAFETIEAFQEASGLCVPAEENGGDPGGVQPRHVEEHIHALAKRVEALEGILEPLGEALVDLRRVSLAIREAMPEAADRLRSQRMAIYAVVRRCEQAIAPEAVSIANRRAGRASS